MKTVVFYIRPNRYFETREALNQEGFCAFYSENVLGTCSLSFDRDLYILY